jgi:energy-coupling factor transporter ATP-binding protein EcfA2
MAKLLIVYISQSSQRNLIHGLKNGIWGFKERVSGDILNINITEDTYLLMGVGYDGGSPRVTNDKWNVHNLTNIYFAKVDSNAYFDQTPEWEDEYKLEVEDRYSVRFRFDKFSLLEFKNIPISNLHIDVSEKLRLSAIAQSRGYLLDDIDIDEFKEKMSLYLTDLRTNNDIRMVSKTKSPKEIIEYIYKYIISTGYRYKYDEIANFYLSLRTKPFVILAGISGTGKTQLPRKFAASLGFEEKQLRQIPVRPDWTDSSDLLGYTALDGNFIQKELTIAIFEANKCPNKPFFFILDEMNLARVEHYFSDYLSVIETRERVDGKIKTEPILSKEMLKNAKNSSELSAIGIPENLYLIGTVNMDETTHTFSRKVLDRANTIEMNDINLDWIQMPDKNIESLKNISNDLFKTEFIESKDLTDSDKKSIDKEVELLKEINIILTKADLQFGYRVRDEIAFYLILNKKYKLIEDTTAIDFQLTQKILPRIHGSSERVQTLLIEFLNLLENKSFKTNSEIADIVSSMEKDNLKYYRATKKILFMLKRFDDDRFTSFWL